MVEVEQICARPRRDKGDDDTSVEDVETWSTKGVVSFRGKDKHSVSGSKLVIFQDGKS